MRVRAASAAITVIAAASAAAAQPPPDPEWKARAAALLPKGYVAGQVYRIDEDAGVGTATGYLAAYPEGSDDPASPGSVFDPGSVLVVKLRPGQGRLEPEFVEFRAHEPVTPVEDPADHSEGGYAYLHRELRARANYPAGTEPCDLRAWSIDTDPHGLNVRAKPSADARILGTLPPPYRFESGEGLGPEAGWRTEFDVIGYANGWFLIEHADPPGRDYMPYQEYPEDHPEPFAGRGWVAASLVGAQYANGDTDMGGLFQAPHIDAKWAPALNAYGGEIGATAGRSASSPAAAYGRWSRATTASVAGGGGSARAR